MRRTPRTKLIRFLASELAPANLSREDLALLVDVGLPEAAAPMLSFGPKGSCVRTVRELYGVPKSHWVIGSDGAGNPLCLSRRRAGVVVQIILDLGGKERFVSRSVTALAESILAYGELVRDTIKQRGPDAFLDWDVPGEVLTRCEKRIKEVDAAAMAKGAVWRLALE